MAKSSIRIAVTLVIGAVLTAMGPGVARADQVEDIRQAGELVCGVLGTDEPNSFVDPATRTIVGYDVDLCAAVAARLGVKLTIKQLAVAARIPELQQGRVDILAASLTHTKEREEVIDFSLTTFVTGQKVLVRRASGIASISELDGRRVSTVKGGTQEPNIRRAVPGVQVVTFETTPQALVALQQRKSDGFVNDEVSLLTAYAKLGRAQKDYLILPENISVEPLALGLRKGEPAFKAFVDDVLHGLEASGEAERLFIKWYGPDSRVQFPARTFRIETDRVDGP